MQLYILVFNDIIEKGYTILYYIKYENTKIRKRETKRTSYETFVYLVTMTNEYLVNFIRLYLQIRFKFYRYKQSNRVSLQC